VDIPFTTGSGEPVEDEVLTGSESSSTAVVVAVVKTSGTWAGSDAAGWITCSSPSAWDGDTGHWGTEDEAITGSTAAALTLNGYGHIKKYGVLHATSDLVERDGKRMCRAHYNWYWGPKDRDAQIPQIDESERGEEW